MSEARTFNCPTCGSSLLSQGGQPQVKCPYCGNTVIVPPELRRADSAHARAANPISIVMSDSGTSIQVTDLSALQPKPMNIVISESQLAGQPSITVSPATTRWMKIGIWSFVILMVVTFVVPFACSICGIFGGFAGAILPFFVK